MIIVFSSHRKSPFVLRLRITDGRRLQQKDYFFPQNVENVCLCVLRLLSILITVAPFVALT